MDRFIAAAALIYNRSYRVYKSMYICCGDTKLLTCLWFSNTVVFIGGDTGSKGLVDRGDLRIRTGEEGTRCPDRPQLMDGECCKSRLEYSLGAINLSLPLSV